MRSLFGTDGIRGEAGRPPLDDATVSRIGRALVTSLEARGFATPITIVLGCDTRESSTGIAEALAGGVAAAHGRVSFAGVIPTPGIAYLVQSEKATAGVVISASHNPWRDNGVKIFSSSGRKLPDEVELEIEGEIAAAAEAPTRPLSPDGSLTTRYIEHLVGTLPHRLDGLTVVVDAANGAAYEAAPAAFRAAGARVLAMNVDCDGRNINDACGALHPEGMVRRTVEARADLGIALDGDADRIVVADGSGRLLDGDDVLFLWTLELIREGRKPSAVVGTVMSNWSLEEALASRGIRLVRAAVGDRYVVDAMEKEGTLLGGEPSGHLIRSDLTTTGDGTLTGLHLAALVAASGRALASLPQLTHTPQVLKNVRVKSKMPFEDIPRLSEETARCESLLGGRGRVLLRYSGTEPLARVMVEGTDPAVVEEVALCLAGAIDEAIGVTAI